MKIYALRWKQSGRISCVEAYTDRERAESNAEYNNAGLPKIRFQKCLGRYWEVVTINVVEGRGKVHNEKNRA